MRAIKLTFVLLAIGTNLVAFQLQEALDCLCVLRRPVGGRVRSDSS